MTSEKAQIQVVFDPSGDVFGWALSGNAHDIEALKTRAFRVWGGYDTARGTCPMVDGEADLSELTLED